MQKALRLAAMVLPGGKVEITSPELEAGQRVNVIVAPYAPVHRRSAVDILAECPGQRLFKTAEEVDYYIKGERASWDR